MTVAESYGRVVEKLSQMTAEANQHQPYDHLKTDAFQKKCAKFTKMREKLLKLQQKVEDMREKVASC